MTVSTAGSRAAGLEAIGSARCLKMVRMRCTRTGSGAGFSSPRRRTGMPILSYFAAWLSISLERGCNLVPCAGVPTAALSIR